MLAQEAPDPARVAFERGTAALEGSRFTDAMEAFEASWARRPLPVVSYNLGLAYRGLGRHVDAVAAFERYLRAPEPDAPPDRLAALREEVARLRATLVTLRVTLDPPDATLRVDGRSVVIADGEVIVDPGARSLDVTAREHLPAHRDLSLAPGSRTSLEVRLVPIESQARLLVEPSVRWATVYVDQRVMGVGETDVGVAPGRHTIEVRADGFRPYRDVVWSSGRRVLRVSAALSPEVTPQPPGRPRWLWPVVLTGGALLTVGLGILAAWLLRGHEPVHPGEWQTFCEAQCP